MKPKEILAATNNTWKNDTDEYFLLIAASSFNGAGNPMSANTVSGYSSTVLTDPENNEVDAFFQMQYQNTVIAGSLSDEVLQYAMFRARERMLIPPHWSLTQFNNGYGFYLTISEVEKYILGGK